MKLDFRKANDLVRWSFIDHVLYMLGFGDIWRGWIKSCIVTALKRIELFVIQGQHWKISHKKKKKKLRVPTQQIDLCEFVIIQSNCLDYRKLACNQEDYGRILVGLEVSNI